MKSEQIHMLDEDIKRHILIVDDDKDFADSLLDILELEGYECEVSNSATRALQKIKHFKAQVALIDIRLGRSSGIDLIARLKKARPHILCVMITAYAALETATQALQEGAYDYLRKPINFQDLMCTLDRCFDKLQLEREKASVDMALRIRNQELEEINARLRNMVESIKRMSSCSNMRQMGPLLLDEFSNNIKAEGGSLFLCEREGLALLHTLDPGHAPDYIPFPLKQGTIFHRIMTEGKPILTQDIQNKNKAISSGWNGYKDGSLLVFPLNDEKGEMIGIVSLHNKLLPPFRSQDLELGTILASYCCESLRATWSAEALHESEERYRALFEKSRDAIFITTLDGQIVEANKSALDLFGFTVDEFISIHASSFYVNHGQRAQLQNELSQKGF
ncbi:MAG: response regulator, partial [Thermodesulfobacteriota bacterium]|nr:response regulator [Thermodesulfobacteriota bacterium]